MLKNEQGVLLVSGMNAGLFEKVLSDQTTPYDFMMMVLGAERYQKICA